MTGPLRELRWVGPHTAARLEAADITPAALRERRVSYAELREAGVNPGVAALLRRRHSLPWDRSGGGGDLDRRAAQVRGLGEAERAWVAASDGDWTTRDGTHDSARGRGQDRERAVEWPEPTPPTAVSGIGPARAERLAGAGVVSVRALLAADTEALADACGFPVAQVRRWQRRAAEQQ